MQETEQSEINSKVAGVSFENRQELIKGLGVGDDLILEREPGNPYDANAVKIMTKDGRHLGYIRKALAYDLAQAIDAGRKYTCFISGITGQTHDTLGINIVIKYKRNGGQNAGNEIGNTIEGGSDEKIGHTSAAD